MKPYEGDLPLEVEQFKWDSAGLIPAVVQDVQGRVLMVAHMNREALAETLATGYGAYFSRSRQKLWRKGESSGLHRAAGGAGGRRLPRRLLFLLLPQNRRRPNHHHRATGF